MLSRNVYIASVARTPIGGYGGALSSLPATELGSITIKEALKRSQIPVEHVDQVIFGNVLSANLGQNPTRQAAIGAGLLNSVICTTVNKVCASGMKSLMLGAQAILCGDSDVVVVGGMESMSNVPYYVPKARFGARFGNTELVDGLVHDGLFDVYNKYVMGNAADGCARDFSISREEQDQFAISSYERAQNASAKGLFKDEIVPVTIKGRKGVETLSTDEEIVNLNEDKLKKIKPAFNDNGTVTAPNSSKLSDGAACLVLISGEKAKELGIPVMAKISGYADAERAPHEFTVAPSLAIPKALSKAGLGINDISFFEINEAFSVVSLANMKLLNLDSSKVNVNGGAVALGHPLGCSGARIIVTLLSVLNQNNSKYGCAGICNGGGGASAVVVERIADKTAKI